MENLRQKWSLRSRMYAEGLNKKQFAERIGIEEKIIDDVLDGVTYYSRKIVNAICNYNHTFDRKEYLKMRIRQCEYELEYFNITEEEREKIETHLMIEKQRLAKIEYFERKKKGLR